MFFDSRKYGARPMKRRALLALLAASEPDIYRIAEARRAMQSCFDSDGYLKPDPAWGMNAHRRESRPQEAA